MTDIDLTDTELGARLSELTSTIERAGQERARLIRAAAARYPDGHPDRWTQARIAQAARISQAAVSKTLNRNTREGSQGWRYGALLRAYKDLAEAAGQITAWYKLEELALESSTVLTTVRTRGAMWLAKLDRAGHPEAARLRERISAAEADLTFEVPGRLSPEQRGDAVLAYAHHARR